MEGVSTCFLEVAYCFRNSNTTVTDVYTPPDCILFTEDSKYSQTHVYHTPYFYCLGGYISVCESLSQSYIPRVVVLIWMMQKKKESPKDIMLLISFPRHQHTDILLSHNLLFVITSYLLPL